MIQNCPLNIFLTIFVHSDQRAPLLPLGRRISPAWKVKSYIAIRRHLILLTAPFYIHLSSLLHLTAGLDEVQNALGFFGFNSNWPSLMDMDQDRQSKQPLVAYKGTVGLWSYLNTKIRSSPACSRKKKLQDHDETCWSLSLIDIILSTDKIWKNYI
jgi:hypothetical protein